MELQQYLRMLLRGWWIVALTVLASVSLALGASYIATPMYKSTARLVLGASTASAGTQATYTIDAVSDRKIVTTYAEVLSSSRIFAESGTSLGMSAKELEDYKLLTVVAPEANILEVSVTGPDAAKVATLANGVAERTSDYIDSLYRPFDLNTLDMAVPAEEPYKPEPLKDTILAGALGLALGVVLAFLREYLVLPLAVFQQQTAIDGASSAYTRRYFHGRLEDELADTSRRPLSLGLVRLTGLEETWETLPDPIRRRLLRHVTGTLRNELRGKDIVGRWEETGFSVLLPGISGREATRSLELIQNLLSEPIELETDGEMIRLSPRVGVATCTTDKPANWVVERAEAALERAQSSGFSFVSADLPAAVVAA